MRKSNKVKQLNRKAEHRNAMLNNMATSLLYHERIETTVAKAKALRPRVEKLITKAKHNLSLEDEAKKLANIRLVARFIQDKEVLHKLFTDIADRFKERPGGYTRIIRIGRRQSDSSEMAIIELVERKELAQLKEERKKLREERKKSKGAFKKA
ncbi:MAG: 50S ribosomal protein L17 [Candidatus Hydrogenedentota bacterium]|nr:MAG: 50S ribosomal protein L17 [Candidatus Hydrogenedentota bacterium]